MANTPANLLKAQALITILADQAFVGTSETTASTSFVNLATTGPSITLTTGTSVLIAISSNSYMSSLGGNAVMSVEVTGATSIAATSLPFAESGTANAGFNFPLTRFIVITTLTPGSNTFTIKYKATGGVAGFSNRSITGMVLGN